MLTLSSQLRALGHHCELFFFRHGQMERYLPADAIVHFGDLAACMTLVRQRGFDVVHARSSDWETGLSAVCRLGAKLVVTSHGFVGPGWNSTNCHALTTCSEWLAEKQRRLTDMPVKAVLNGIDIVRHSPARTPSSSPRPIVAWVGRGIDARKGLDKFAAIAPRLHQAGIRVRVVDPYGPDAVAKVMPEAAHMLRSVADSWGAVSVERMPEMYREVSASGGCVVSTASWEGLPLTLLEGQACGAPVIGPDVPGTNECVSPNHGGVLYPWDYNADQLAALVVETVSDSVRMDWRRAASLQFVREQFTAERMARQYLQIYQDAPYPRKVTVDGLRARHLLSPWNWKDYLEHGRSAGLQQFEAAQKLADHGEWKLARSAARSSLRNSPTIYVRRRRLALLLKTHAALATPKR